MLQKYNTILNYKYHEKCGFFYKIGFINYFMIVNNGSPYVNSLMRILGLKWWDCGKLFNINDIGGDQQYLDMESFKVLFFDEKYKRQINNTEILLIQENFHDLMKKTHTPETLKDKLLMGGLNVNDTEKYINDHYNGNI